MLEVVATQQNKVSIRATVRRVAVYLDNHSIIDLAKGSAERRKRFIGALAQGADLMFSPVNAAEITGPECQSSLGAVKALLDAVGPYWFPVDGANVMAVVGREAAGADRATACLSSWFLNQFFAGHNIWLHGEQRFDLVEPEFFRLGFVLDWLHPQRADIRQRLSDFDNALSRTLADLRSCYEQRRQGFEQLLPEPHYDDSRPATFVWNGLLRRLTIEAKAYKFKRGDGADLCHAVIASAFANFATLDKQWKRRVSSLPKPNRLARIYYAPELDQLVADLEAALT